jgi:hypothetical protein
MPDPASSLEYQTPPPPTSPDLAPIIALVLGVAGCVLNLLLWRGVIAGGDLLPPLLAAATAVLAGIAGVVVGIAGRGAKSRSARQLSMIAVGFSLICLLSWLCMAVWFLRHLRFG